MKPAAVSSSSCELEFSELRGAHVVGRADWVVECRVEVRSCGRLRA